MESLADIYEGWSGHQTSLVHAIAPLDSKQLRWRPNAKFQSVGELTRHLALGRIIWFVRMNAPGSAELAEQITDWVQDNDGNQHIVESKLPIAEEADALAHWLVASWQMIERTISSWTVADLSQTYQHKWNGAVYAVSRQWTLWRILTHDVHHGGQIALMLGMQGIEVFELGDLFGHITLPPLYNAT